MNWNIRLEITLSQGTRDTDILRYHVKEFVHADNARKFFNKFQSLITSLVALLK